MYIVIERPSGNYDSPKMSDNAPMRTVPNTYPATSKTKSVISTPGSHSNTNKPARMFTLPFKKPRTIVRPEGKGVTRYFISSL